MNKFEKTLLKHNIGYLDERDEYQQGVIYETLATANLYLSYLLIICMVISLIFDGINHSLTFGTFALAALQFGNSCYILNKLKKSGAYETEVYDDYTYNIEIKKTMYNISNTVGNIYVFCNDISLAMDFRGSN
ncbi:hypothetical protein ACSXBQ_11760 [Clostridium perfringens]